MSQAQQDRDREPGGAAAAADTATYAYCVVRSSAPSALEGALAGAPEGVPGAGPLRPLDLGGGLWLAVAAVPREEYSAPAIERRLEDLGWVSERALAHEAVVEHLAAGAPVVPLKLFTLFHDDERARRQMAAERPRLEGALERVAGRSEWGLKVFLEPSPAPAVAASAAASGTAFLERKRQARAAARERLEGTRAAAAELFAALAAAAVEAIEKPAPPVESGARLLLEAAFLVDDAAAGELERRAAAGAEALAAVGGSVTLTGPWPPYHFVGEAGG